MCSPFCPFRLFYPFCHFAVLSYFWQNVFPQLRCLALSANKVLAVMGNAKGAISTPGFAVGRLGSALTPQSVVLALSQSGQTFPTLQATRILCRQCPG